MTLLRLSLCLLAALVVFPPVALAGDPPPPPGNLHYGHITADRTLTAAAPGPIYDVIGDLTVDPGVTLTIEPGVTLRMTADSDFLASGACIDKVDIEVQGRMVAEGTIDNRIRFVSSRPGSGYWCELRIASIGSATLSHIAILDTSYPGLNVLGSASVTGDTLTSAYVDGSGSLTLTDATVSSAESHGSLSLSDSEVSWVTSSGSLTVSGCQLNTVTSSGMLYVRGTSCPTLRAAAGTVDIAGVTSAEGEGIDVRGASGRLRECTVLGADFGLRMGPGLSTVPDDTLNVQPVEIYGCDYGLWMEYGAAASNILCHRSKYSGISMAGNNVLNYCTSVSNGLWGDEGIVAGSGGTILNSIAVSNSNYGIRGDGGTWVDYVDSWGNTNGQYSAVTRGAHTSVFDPGFVNPAAWDYRLSGTSLFLYYSNSGGQIGAYGPGPTVVAVEPQLQKPTWSAIKAKYR